MRSSWDEGRAALLRWLKRCWVPAVVACFALILLAAAVRSALARPVAGAAEQEHGSTAEDVLGTETLNIVVRKNQEDELVFSIAIDEFVDGFNRCYGAEYGSDYLAPPEQWICETLESSIHWDGETLKYRFSENVSAYTLPTVSVYSPASGGGIQLVTVDFDQHCYSQSLYGRYEMLCFYALKVFFPELSDEAIVELYQQVNALGEENVFSSDEWYTNGSVPCALFYKDGIGVYPYFAAGDWEHLCIIPVTEAVITAFEQKGVVIYEME